MAGNSYGQLFRITTFGESHGAALGVIIDGCPPLLEIDEAMIRDELARRKPGQSSITSPRKEGEAFELLSGVFEGKTTGAPICIMVRNEDQRPEEYEQWKNTYRPSHADYTYDKKYGIRDHRGSGRASARETIARVIAGAVAKMLLNNSGISVQAYVSQVGHLSLSKSYLELDLTQTERNPVRCPEPVVAAQMTERIEQARAAGDSVGGSITCVIKGAPAGLGDPVFDKLHADLGKAMLSINACKGFEIGSGFGSSLLKGSEHNDPFEANPADHTIRTTTNHSGGVQGGISNGEDIYFRCAFKPVSTIAVAQQTVDKTGKHETIAITGRHDPCVLPRAVVIVEAMAAITIADHLLRHKAIS